MRFCFFAGRGLIVSSCCGCCCETILLLVSIAPGGILCCILFCGGGCCCVVELISPRREESKSSPNILLDLAFVVFFVFLNIILIDASSFIMVPLRLLSIDEVGWIEMSGCCIELSLLLLVVVTVL